MWCITPVVDGHLVIWVVELTNYSSWQLSILYMSMLSLGHTHKPPSFLLIFFCITWLSSHPHGYYLFYHPCQFPPLDSPILVAEVWSAWLHNVLVLTQFKFEAWIVTLWSPVPQSISSRNHDLMMPSASTNYFKLWPHLCQTLRYHDARSRQPILSWYCEKTIENHQIPSTTPILSRI